MFYKIIKLILYPIFKLIFLFKVKNRPKIEKNKRLIICGNHISNLDPILFELINPEMIHFMAKKELFDNKFLSWILPKFGTFPVDRGNNDIDAIRQSIKVLKDDKILGIFPEGTRIKQGQTSRERFIDGVAMIAVKANADILPIQIKGEYKPFGNIEFIYKDIIKIDKFENKNKKELYKDIMDEIYDSIFNK